MIKFRMFGIHIDQFAILSKSAPLEDLGLGVNLNYKYANKGRIISCSTEFNFLNSAQEKIMILAITCEFEIEENDYKNRTSLYVSSYAHSYHLFVWITLY